MMNSDFVRPIQHDITGREAIENPASGRFTGQDERSKQCAKFTRDGEHTDAPSNVISGMLRDYMISKTVSSPAMNGALCKVSSGRDMPKLSPAS